MASAPPGTIRNCNLQLQNESPLVVTIVNLTNTLANLFLGAVAMNAFVYVYGSKFHVFTEHIYLCVFGYVILMPQAIMSINTHTGWARAFNSNNRITIHYILQTIASVLGLAGCVKMMAMQHHGFYRDIPVHSIFGLLTMLFTILSLIAGAIDFYSSKLSVKKDILKLIHPIMGCATVIFAFAALVFPANAKKYFNSTNTILVISVTVISVILVLASPILGARRKLA